MLLEYSSFEDGLFGVLENFYFYTFIHDQKSKLYKSIAGFQSSQVVGESILGGGE